MTVATATATAIATAPTTAPTAAPTAATATGAASHAEVDWHSIDWPKVHQNVRRLQARIVKATQQGRWGKVKALQHLLTHSFSAKTVAVKRVTENHGKRTPGVDGETWDTPTKKATAVQSLRQRGYHPKPVRRVYLMKSNGKRRPLGIPAMHDRAMQALYLLALDPIAETTADPHSYGFRSERSPADAIEQCFRVLARGNSAQWILEADIAGCFDSLSHSWLETHIPMDKRVLQAWLKAGFMEKGVLYSTDAGTPQGAICSPVLANLALDGLEQRLRQLYPARSRKANRAKVNLVRFADDFIVTGSSRELLEQQIQPLVTQFLGERGLTLSEEKTHITHIEEGFDFLGQHLRKYHNGRGKSKQYKLLITPSYKSVRAFLTKIRGVVKGNKQATAGHLIMQLNPVIRGWANYHRHVVSTATFHRVDHAIFCTLWQWAKRRHPNKTREWIKQKYFQRCDLRDWVLFGEVTGRGGKAQIVRLLNAASVAIERHTLIEGTANPYDPAWEPYFEHRLGMQMAANLVGGKKLLYLWKEQKGICPVCGQKITKLTGWDNHHIVWRVYGGGDGAGNRMLLHPNCHRQVHSQNRKLEVAKPRPPTEAGERKA